MKSSKLPFELRKGAKRFHSTVIATKTNCMPLTGENWISYALLSFEACVWAQHLFFLWPWWPWILRLFYQQKFLWLTHLHTTQNLLKAVYFSRASDFHSSVTSLDLNPSGPCTFENDQCRWTDVSDGQSKWQRQRASNNTEPPTDHTADTGGCYWVVHWCYCHSFTSQRV